MLARLGGRPLLGWVLARAMQSREIDSVVLAIPKNSRDDELEKIAESLGATVFRGEEDDVLDRIQRAAESSGADIVVRVCADNPFVDPGEIDRLVRFFAAGDADYAFNHLDRLESRYADGFGAEILRSDVLSEIARTARDPRHREHVTLHLWDNPANFRMAAVPAPPELSHPTLRFDVDSPRDLLELEKLVAAGVDLHTPAAEIVRRALALANFRT